MAYRNERQIPHEFPRSACVTCPCMINLEGRHLRDNDPAGWARAVEVDEALRRESTVANRNLEQSIYLHQSFLPPAVVGLARRT